MSDIRKLSNLLVSRLTSVAPVYEIPEDDLVSEVLVPALETTDRVDIAVGFFSSHCISQIAPGLASLVSRDVTCRLLVSPELSEEDRDAIDRGISQPDALMDRFMVDILLEPPDALAAHTADILACLIAIGTLQIRCVLMDRGMFHKKMWMFEADGIRMSVHGSGNMTARGLFVNGEQMTIDRPWMDGASATKRVDDLYESFELEWENKKPGRLTIEPKQMIELLRGRKQTNSDPPTTSDFWKAWAQDRDAGLTPALPPGMAHPPASKRLSIPGWLDWTQPPYGHQERAVEAIKACDYTGLIAMATGGGKTKTALISVCQLQDGDRRPLLVVIVVPTKVLAAQWVDDVRDFGINPILLSGMDPPARGLALEDVAASLQASEPRTEVLITTFQGFTRDNALKTFLEESSTSATSVLIADEAHNFGAPSFVNDLPEYFEYRIGLSATPVRQYDAEGTTALFQFFKTAGEPAFSFTLGEAIKSGCLTPYRYLIHEVALTESEMERYLELTDQLRQSGFGVDDGNDWQLTDRQKSLLRERRALVEQADAKIECLRELLAPQAESISHTLIYCSAKAVKSPHNGKQIDLARRVLKDLGITTHKYTGVETGKSGSEAFLTGFGSGDFQTLLAMKVLDEGVDIPAAKQAFLLASSTVEREWVQRRGRVLRNFPGKNSADLHDFIVLPPESADSGGRGLIRNELRRAEHFTADAENKYEDDGPLAIIKTIEQKF